MTEVNFNIKNQSGGVNIGEISSSGPSIISNTKRPISVGGEDLIDKYFPVHEGFISLIDYSGNDQAIEKAARTSYGGGTRKVSQTRGLLRYLMRKRHTSPYEMVELKFHIAMPIFVMRQLVRHRSANINEISGRYSLMPMLFYMPTQDNFKKQSKDNKQGRAEKIELDKYKAAIDRWQALRKESETLYKDLAEENVARELARIDLPLSAYTVCVWKIDLHNLFHFLNLRTDPHAQYEIRAYADIMAGMVKHAFPLSYEAWYDYQKNSVNFSRMEMNILQDMLWNSGNDNNLWLQLTSDKYKNHEFIEKSYGLSRREIIEFIEKVNNEESYYIRLNKLDEHGLDLSKAKSPEYFEEKMKNAVPIIDQNG